MAYKDFRSRLQKGDDSCGGAKLDKVPQTAHDLESGGAVKAGGYLILQSPVKSLCHAFQTFLGKRKDLVGHQIYLIIYSQMKDCMQGQDRSLSSSTSHGVCSKDVSLRRYRQLKQDLNYHEQGPLGSCNHLSSGDPLLLTTTYSPDHLTTHLQQQDCHWQYMAFLLSS